MHMNELLLPKSGISYRTNAFAPNRPTILFIHGLTGSSSAWFEYERSFEGNFNLINVDLRGHGNSTKPNKYSAYSIEAHADAIAELLNHIDTEHLIVVSHSFATLIALQLILKHTPKLRGLILLSPTYGIERGLRAAVIGLLVSIAVTAFAVFPFAPSVRGRTDYLRHRNTGDWNVARMYDDIRNTSLRVYFFCLSHIYRFKQAGKWEQLSVPATILHGRRDSLVPVDNAVQLNRIMPNSRLTIIDSGNHIIVLNNTKEIAAAINTMASPPQRG